MKVCLVTKHTSTASELEVKEPGNKPSVEKMADPCKYDARTGLAVDLPVRNGISKFYTNHFLVITKHIYFKVPETLKKMGFWIGILHSRTEVKQ